MLVAMESPSRISAGLVKSKNEESLRNAVSSTWLTLRLWKLKSRFMMKSAIGIRWVLMTPIGAAGFAQRDGFLRHRHHFVGGDHEIGRAGDDARTGDVGGVLGQPDMAQHRAALLRKAGHVEDHAGLALDMRGHAEQRADRQHAGAADAADRDIVGPIQRGPRCRFGQIADIAEIGRRAAAQLAAVDGDEGRAKALQAGIILVAGRLIDGALAPHFGLQRLDRDAVRLHRTIAAAFADRGIDQDAALRILQRAAFAAAALFGGTGLHEHDGRGALDLAQLLHHGVELVAMRGLGARRDLGSRIGIGIFRHQIDVADAFASEAGR